MNTSSTSSFALVIFIGVMLYIIVDDVLTTPTYYDEVLEVGIPYRIPVGLSLRHSQLAKMLRLLREHHAPVLRMSFLPHIGRWWRFWYGQY